jgi:hypothetical protein
LPFLPLKKRGELHGGSSCLQRGRLINCAGDLTKEGGDLSTEEKDSFSRRQTHLQNILFDDGTKLLKVVL